MTRNVQCSFARRLIAIAAIFVGMSAVGGAAAGSPGGTQCTVEQGQMFIDAGRYDRALREFTCVIDAQPTEVEGYRGRIEADLLLGRFSDAVHDYTRVTAFVLPVHSDATATIEAGYADRLATAPHDIPALTGASFARWWFFQYAGAIQLLNDLVAVQPQGVYGNLFRGSSRLLSGATKDRGVADLDRAIALAPNSPDVRFIVSDAYTYGLSDPQRAFAEASLALQWGLDTPRVHAILASAYLAFGDLPAAAVHIKRHIDLVTTDLVPTSPITVGMSLAFELVPGRTYEIPAAAIAGQPISITTGSHDFGDTILALLAPDGTPVVGSDDYKQYFAGFVWTAEETGVYFLQVTSFESVNTGELLVTRK